LGDLCTNALQNITDSEQILQILHCFRVISADSAASDSAAKSSGQIRAAKKPFLDKYYVQTFGSCEQATDQFAPF
jgi:hypothetical protein